MEDCFIRSPLEYELRNLFASCERDVIVVCPYLTYVGSKLVSSSVQVSRSRLSVRLLTDIHPRSLQDGSLEPSALISLWDDFPQMRLAHLRGLHAKVYVVDEARALVTSANLTRGGMRGNFEYSVLISEARKVSEIVNDMNAYFDLADELSYESLKEIEKSTSELRKADEHSHPKSDIRLEQSVNDVLHATQNKSRIRETNAELAYQIFKFTLPSILQNDPMTLLELKVYMRETVPHLCDDNTVYTYGGGIRHCPQWEQDLRQALNTLKKQGVIKHDAGRNGLWHFSGGT